MYSIAYVQKGYMDIDLVWYQLGYKVNYTPNIFIGCLIN